MALDFTQNTLPNIFHRIFFGSRREYWIRLKYRKHLKKAFGKKEKELVQDWQGHQKVE